MLMCWCVDANNIKDCKIVVLLAVMLITRSMGRKDEHKGYTKVIYIGFTDVELRF